MEALEHALERRGRAAAARALRPRRLQALQRRLRPPGRRRAAARGCRARWATWSTATAAPSASAATSSACCSTTAPSDALLVDAARALEARGDGFDVTASYGVVAPAGRRRHARRRRSTSPTAACTRPRRRGRAPPGLQTRTVLLKVLSEREPDLHEHSSDVMALARGVARRLGLPVEERDIVARAAELHDIGKMAIPDAILNKPGPLDDREWRFMRRHTIIGEDILNVAPALQPVAALVRASHERWDGKGYPDGTAGDEIPRGARIVAVCDAFSAMVQDRPYQAGLSVQRGRRRDQALRGHELRPARWSRRSPPRSAPRRCPREARPRGRARSRSPASRRAARGGARRAGRHRDRRRGQLVRQRRAACCACPRRRRRRCWSPARRCATRGRSPWRGDGALLRGRRGRGGGVRDHARRQRSARSSAARGLDDPVGHRAGAGGTAYLSDRQRDAVLRLDLATGALTHGRRSCSDAAGLAMDKAGKLLVTDGAWRCAASTPAPARSRPSRRARRSTTRVTSPSSRTARCTWRATARSCGSTRPTGAKSVLAAGAPLSDPRAIDIEPDGDLVVADGGSPAAGHPRRPRDRAP